MSIDERDYYYNPKLFRGKKNNRYSSIGKNTEKNIGKYIASIMIIIAIASLLMWVRNNAAQKALSNIEKNALAQQQKIMQQAQASENWRKQQEAEQAKVQQRIKTQQPRYERVLVKGKSGHECKSNNGVLDNYAIKCMNDHYEMMIVNVHQ